MKDFLKSLENQKVTTGEKLISEALIVAQKILVNMGLDFIPPAYVQFMKKYNGVKSENAFLCGATVDDDMDIIDKNKDIKKPQNCILLGYNKESLLCFNYKSKKYQIVDKDDLTVLNTFNNDDLGKALDMIFNV
ncbi:MAG: hypothetical protein J6N49_00385 [Alphaproteobacteria bacterium]|nr:hypothetical protein [Alphaproteobacteria bacterium]